MPVAYGITEPITAVEDLTINQNYILMVQYLLLTDQPKPPWMPKNKRIDGLGNLTNKWIELKNILYNMEQNGTSYPKRRRQPTLSPTMEEEGMLQGTLVIEG